tara:strand:+ start:10854 stop:12875 length:2022 start_codon:yes stop_codon:yes gene_type:complete
LQLDATKQIEEFKEFIEDTCKEELSKLIEKGEKSIVIDFKELASQYLDLSEQLITYPEETFKAAEMALDQFELPEGTLLRVRFKNLPDSQKISIRDIRSKHLTSLIALEGIVRQASDVRPQVTSARFECPSCGNVISILQLESKFKEPSRCSCGRQGKFRLLSKDLVDAQRLVIEEAAEDLDGGEQPKRLSIFLKEDLVEPKMEKKTTPGAKIRATGIVKEVPIQLKTGAQSTRYDLMLESNFIEPIQETFEEVILTPEEEREIQTLAKDKRVFEKLIASVGPSILGHEDIKEALILQMMGGVKKIKIDNTIIRGDMHILLVGDPGSAKSTLLTFITKAAPKSRYVAGRSASAAGITASVVRDEFLKGWALEAGAIVLANKGILALDEMDKMSEEDTSALHEAMEQQQISVSKANIQAVLRAETTVLAAANPKLGRFDPYQPLATQIALPPALINRFDLIFPVRDIPNKEKDEKIASHVLKIQQDPEDIPTEISIDMLKKYVAYARKVNPKLTDGAVEEIKEFYVTLRNSGSSGDEEIKPIPISARQLEALVRLAEGAARVRLSTKVTKQDAKRAITLLKNCLMQVGFDKETGQFDIDKMSTGITASQRGKIVTIREIIANLEKKGMKTIPIDDIMAESMERGVEEDKVDEVLEKLKRSGDIFEPKPGFIQRI